MRLKTIAFAIALLCAPPAEAELVNAGQYTLDTDTNLEWLNLTLTQGVSPDSILSGQGGWVSHGWQFATRAQFLQLGATYLWPSIGSEFSLGAFNSAVAVINALGVTPYRGDGVVSQGFLGDTSFVGYVGAGTQHAYVPDGEWGVRTLSGSFASEDATGDFLVRSGDYVTAPETSTWLMMLLGFAGLGYAARHRVKHT